jgi:hypothetical protein
MEPIKQKSRKDVSASYKETQKDKTLWPYHNINSLSRIKLEHNYFLKIKNKKKLFFFLKIFSLYFLKLPFLSSFIMYQ